MAVTYRITKGSALTDAEIEANFAFCIDPLVTEPPLIPAGTIVNFNPNFLYLTTNGMTVDLVTGVVTGTGKVWALDSNKNLSFPAVVV